MTIMAKDEKKGGFFSRFRKDIPSAHEESGIKPASSPAVPAPNRTVTPTPESRSSLAAAVPSQVPVVPKSVAAPASSESVVDTVEAFSRYCSALVDIGTSQLKVIEMTLTMLSHSLNKITDRSETKG